MKAITARSGKAHITPLMDSMWHQGITGMESCILSAYENFKADIISNNEVRVRSGVGMLQGRFFCNEPNTYDSVAINNGTQGENRTDLIVMRWSVDAATETEAAETIVVQGTPVAGTASAPSAVEGSLDDGDLIVDYPLYEVHLEGINIMEVVPLFTALPGIFLIAPGGVVDIAHGGHGGRTAASGLRNLGGAPLTANAGSHNSIFRGRNLTDVYTIAQICEKIADGSFDDLFIGDYFDISITTALSTGNVTETVRCMLAGFDPYLHNGDTALTQHHAAIVPMNSFKTAAQMNATNITDGGYAGSVMHTTTLPLYATALGNVFGSHLLTYRALLTNTVASGAASNWAWSDCKLRLMTEIELYGSVVWSKAGYDTGIGKSQLPLFSLAPEYIRAGLGGTEQSSRYSFWLSGVSSATYFAYCNHNGSANYANASGSLGVRPLFLIG